MPSLKKTIKFNPLEGSNAIGNKTEAPKREPPTPPLPLETNIAPNQALKMTDYVIHASGERGSSSLLANGSEFGFEVPGLGFINLKSPEMMGQLKNHFLMPRVIGSFVLGGSLGYTVSFILGKPKNKHYFFLLKSSHGKLIFIRFDSLTLAYVINKI